MPQTISPIFRQVALIVCLCTFGNSIVFAAGNPPDADIAKKQLERHGIGSTVRVAETNGTHFQGRLISIGADGAVLAPKGSPDVLVPYAQITSVKGPGLSTGAKVGMIAFVGVAVVGIVAVVLLRNRNIGPIHTGPIH